MALSIGIVGAGTIGAGIAHTAALHQCTAHLYDINEDVIRTGIAGITRRMERGIEKKRYTPEEMKDALARIKPKTHLADLDTCDIVIDAILEDVKIKKDLIKRLDTIIHHTAILASHSSTVSITSLASVTKKPHRVIGTHFFDPVQTSELVEIVRGELTSVETAQRTMDIVQQLGKSCVLTKDTPGYIVNRVGLPYFIEALRIMEEGIASFEEIDRIVKGSGGFTKGPFETLDRNGLDTSLTVHQAVYDQFYHDPRYRPSVTVRRMVEGGKLGVKTKKGFYDYTK